jgi:hypothetical protein
MERNIRQDEGHAPGDPPADGAQGFGQDGKVVNNFPSCRKQFIEKRPTIVHRGRKEMAMQLRSGSTSRTRRISFSDRHISSSPSKTSTRPWSARPRDSSLGSPSARLPANAWCEAPAVTQRWFSLLTRTRWRSARGIASMFLGEGY